jgi:hypothetical protein
MTTSLGAELATGGGPAESSMTNDARRGSSMFRVVLAAVFGLGVAMPATAGVPSTDVGSLAAGRTLVTEAKGYKGVKINKNIKQQEHQGPQEHQGQQERLRQQERLCEKLVAQALLRKRHRRRCLGNHPRNHHCARRACTQSLLVLDQSLTQSRLLGLLLLSSQACRHHRAGRSYCFAFISA